MCGQRWEKDQIPVLFPRKALPLCLAWVRVSRHRGEVRPRVFLRLGVKSRAGLFFSKVPPRRVEPPHWDLKAPQAQSSPGALHQGRESLLLFSLFWSRFLPIPVILHPPSSLVRLQSSCGSDKVLSKAFARRCNELGVAGGVGRRALSLSLSLSSVFFTRQVGVCCPRVRNDGRKKEMG